ncbi:MAG: lysylphosphatidylglycerol synthase domain-containing protein, partial [Patescibacteria group bacterium]
MDKTQLLSWAKFLIGWPLSAVSIIFIIKLIIDKSNELNISFEKINLTYLFLSVALFFIYYLLRSFLWQTELREKGFKIPFKKNTYAFTLSELKRYAPGNIWSFLSRGYQFSKLGVDKKTIGISILADIQLVIIGCGIISLFSVPWLIDSSSELQTKLATLLPASLLAIIIFFVVTSFIYTKKYLKTNSKSILLHSSGFWTNFLLPGFTFNSKIKLSVLAIITYFIFGIGNYFAFISIYQTIGNPLIISSFFVFSL